MYGSFFLINKIVCLIHRGLLVYFFQGGTGVSCPPLCNLVAPFFDLFCRGLTLFRVPVPASGWDGVGDLMGFGVPQACLPE